MDDCVGICVIFGCLLGLIISMVISFCFCEELEEDDYGRFSENAIMKRNLTLGSSQRILIGKNYSLSPFVKSHN